MSNTNFTNIMEIDQDDLLSAMKKLSKMISSDKQFDIDHAEKPSQHFSLPTRMDLNPLQHTFAMSRNDSYPQVDLIGNLRSLAQEVSRLDNSRDEYEPDAMKSGRYRANQSVNQSMNWDNNDSQYDCFGTDRLTDRRNSAVNRLYEQDNRKKEKIAALQFQRYKEELSTMRQKPEISLHSKIIAEQKQKAPIYERSVAIMKQREENINKIRRELEETRGDNDLSLTFQPDLSCTKRYNYERSRTPQEFTAHVYAWHQKKNEAIQKEQYENITKEISELTFKPQINSKSRNIAEKGNTRDPVELRLQKQREQLEAKKQSLAEKTKPSFKPTLNEKSQILAKQRKAQGDKSANNSIIESSMIMEDISKTPTHKRSLTPTLMKKVKPTQDKSPMRSKKLAQKSNEIGRSSAVDFLLRKFE